MNAAVDFGLGWLSGLHVSDVRGLKAVDLKRKLMMI